VTASPRARRSALWRHRRILFLLGLLSFATLAGVAFVISRVPLPEADPPVETTFLYDANGTQLAELSGGENRTSVPLTQVSPHLVDAVLASEDRDFFRHPGVNFGAIARAALSDLRGHQLQGGSTITQQYVKQVYLGSERTISRKIKEATLAIKLERKLSKQEILERYLNRIYFGRGAHGVEAASAAYFGKDVHDLDVAESAYLAGLIRAPELADATTQPEEADHRRDLVLRALRNEHKITESERASLAARPVASYVRPRTDVVHDRITDPDSGTQYFVEYVRRQLADRFGDAAVNGGGLRVYTSLDLGLQRAAHDAVYTDVLNRDGDPSGALVSVDAAGYVRAMVGGRDWDAKDSYARVNFAVGRDGGGTGRQAGSSFKPFVLAAAVADGFTVESAFPAPAKIVFPRANNGKDYTVRNYENESFPRLNLVDATAHSVNTVYAQLIDAIGAERVVSFAPRLGITSELSPVLSLALGTPSVSVLEMADAYLTFATRGMHVAPQVVVKVTDARGNLLWRPKVVTARAMTERESDVVTYALRQVVDHGTGTAAAIDGVAVAGKTGTTQSYGDAWFVGYTPGMSTAVWVGYPDGQDHELRNVHGINVTGGTLPADIWHRFMSVATRDARYRGSFHDPGRFTGKLVPESGRATVGASTTTTAPPSSTSTSTTTTSTSTPGATSTSSTTRPDGSTTTTVTTAPPSSTTTSTAVLPTG
jgi:penicillin-binding protein 1A